MIHLATVLAPSFRRCSATCLWSVLLVVFLCGQSLQDVEVRRDVLYAAHDGVALAGDYYVPRAPGKYPVVIGIHGGAWQLGSRVTDFQYWGSYLAKQGIAVFAISYRLSKTGQPSYPRPIQDVRAAIQFVKYNAVDLRADSQRIALMGNSAGAHLAALTALAGDEPPFAGAYPGDPYAAVNASVKAVVGVYGPYELVEHWNHELRARPGDQSVEKFLGTTPMDNRKVYFEASPISYAVRAHNQISFFLTWGTGDDMVSPSQSEEFLLALKQAGFYVRTAPVPGAPHFWMGMPMDEPRSHTAFVAPQILRFLRERF